MTLANVPSPVPLLNLSVHPVTMENTLDIIQQFITEGGAHHVVTLDAAMCVMAARDADLFRIVDQAPLTTPDGAGVLWACRRRGSPLPERVSGVDIVTNLCARSAETGNRIFFLGAAPGVADAARLRVEQSYPGALIVGVHDGYFAPTEDRRVVEQIRAAAPHILCVAMGIPRQEKWIDIWKGELEVPVLIGVGGTLDVLSGYVRRAPRIVQELNLEWLYRFIRNPRKLSKVILLPQFVWMTVSGR